MMLEGRGLTCVRSERTLFSDLDFTLGAGMALIVRGPNGSGKTSLLRLVAGLLKPVAGTLSRDGVAVTEDMNAYHAELHYVGHLDALKAAFTVEENLAFWAALKGRPGGEAEALARFGMAHLARVPARFLSAGQRRRLTLARVIAAPAPLWLLDEPTSSLDDEAAAILAEVVAEHRAAGGMVMAATHVELGLEGAETLLLGGARARDEARS